MIHRLAGVLLLVLVSACTSATTPQVVAEVAGEPVTAAEFTARMADHRTAVAAYFHEHHRADPNQQAFWSDEIGGTTPRAMLRQRTLDALVEIKVQQIMAREAGLIADIGYDTFLKRLDEENADRRERLERHEPIFGPQQFTEKTYHAYCFDRMVLDLKKTLPASADYPALVAERVRHVTIAIHEDALNPLLP
ncbi:MAG: hypothetical protein HOV79_30045 [Hamadaea sp.]|nr:hypothetical protein [Hamadaea sp.]